MSIIPDTILRKAIDFLYMKYDKDRTNTLDKNELVGCFNELLSMVGSPSMANSFIVGQILKRMDKDGDGKISKPQFLNMFRIFEASSSGLMNQGSTNQNQTGWGNQPNNNNWGNQQQGGFSNQPPNNYGNQGGFNQGGFNQGGYNQGNYGGGFGYN